MATASPRKVRVAGLRLRRIGWRRLWARLLSASAPGLGMLAFSAYIYQLTGNPFQWSVQHLAWGRVYRGIDTLVVDRLGFIAKNGLYAYASTQTIDFFYLLAVLFALGAVWPVYRRFGLPYAALILVNVLPPVSMGGLLSMGRVTSVLFPVFLWMAAAVPAAPSRCVDRALRLPPGICRRDVFYVAADLSSCARGQTPPAPTRVPDV